MLLQGIDFHARHDAALEQAAGVGELALGVGQAQLGIGHGPPRAGHFLALRPVLHVLHGALGFQLRGQRLAQLDIQLRGVERQQVLATLDPLALGNGHVLYQSLERRGEGRLGGGLDAPDQAEVVLQCLRLHVQPAVVGRGGRGPGLVGEGHSQAEQDEAAGEPAAAMTSAQDSGASNR